MSRSEFSIRHQLLLLGALATASIWGGALLQYLQLREQSQELAGVRRDIGAAARYADVARATAQERGLSNGWLLAAGAGPRPAALDAARARLDGRLARLAAMRVDRPAAAPPRTPHAAAMATATAIARLRALVDARRTAPVAVFDGYSAVVESINDTFARRLATGMLVVGLPYEHVTALQRAAERLAQLRGLANGALQAGTLSPDTQAAIIRRIALFEDAAGAALRLAPEDARATVQAAVGSPRVRDTVARASALVETGRVDAVGMDAAAWWASSTRAVDVLQAASVAESNALSQRADARIEALSRRLQLTVLALVVLGIVTLVLVLSTIGRIVRGLDRLITGLQTVGDRRNFSTRIEAKRRDEFGVISGEINKLILIAGGAVREQAALSETDLLTGALNRRGFDRQIATQTAAGVDTPPLSLLMIDVDRFKSINDSLGHTIGDRVLEQLGALLRASLRADDVLARFGGEEFVVLLPGCPLGEALRVAETIRVAIEAHDFGIGRPVTASLGAAQWHPEQTVQGLIAKADARLYEAKAAGRNRVLPFAA